MKTNLQMQGSVHQDWKQRADLAEDFPAEFLWKPLTSLGSPFSPIRHSPRLAKTADQSTNKSIALYNLSRRRENWFFCSNSAFQVWFGLRNCFGDSVLQVPLPTHEVSNRLDSMAASGSFVPIQQHNNCEWHYPASKASCFHFPELPRVAGAFWERWPGSALKVIPLNPVSFLSSSCFNNNSTQKLYASLTLKVGLLPSS